jgi:putative membrane protein
MTWAFILLLAGCASKPDRYAGLPGLKEYDRDFMVASAEQSIAAVHMCEIAQRHGQTDAVRLLARQFLAERRQMLDEQINLGYEKGMPLPSTPNATDQAAVRMLAHTGADELDHRFIEELNDLLATQFQLLTQASQKAIDPDVRAYAARMLPPLQREIKQLNSR